MSNHIFLRSLFQKEKIAEAEFQVLLNEFTKVKFSKNDLLFKAGTTVNAYYLLETGIVRAYANTPENTEVSTGFFTSTDIIIDWPSFFMRQPTKENYQALSDGIAWKLGIEKFHGFFNSIEGFREEGRSRLVKSYFDLKSKSVSMITDDAKQRYLKLMKHRPEVTQNVPLKYIASYLGITDTSLSRIRREIAKNK